MPTERLQCQCCVVGGGPAGMMHGFLLARSGVDVVVLEKHGDFLRDFRGDTIHPSTLDVMHELGLIDEFLKRPHQKVQQLTGQIGTELVTMAEFSRLSTKSRFLVLMPQWDFLNFIAEHARQFSRFHLRMQAEVTGLIEEDGVIAGVVVKTTDGELEVRAPLVVGADGRSSLVRDRSGLKADDFGAPMDVLWMRLSRQPDDPDLAGRVDHGRLFVTLNRGEYWQCGMVIPKGGAEELQRKGIQNFRAAIAEVAPFLAGRVEELRDWNDVKLLTVKVDRLRQWYRPGFLCIGDAAHAMSPVGGIGINLAIQDAVAAANILAAPLRENRVTAEHLAEVQRRRLRPTVWTQRFQLFVQRQFVERALASSGRLEPGWVARWIFRSKFLIRLRGWIIGVGFRPEHVQIAEVKE